MSNKSYWIKERHNPQFEKPYYVPYGQMSAKEARKHENARYGDNYMLKFTTKKEYELKLKELRKSGDLNEINSMV